MAPTLHSELQARLDCHDRRIAQILRQAHLCIDELVRLTVNVLGCPQGALQYSHGGDFGPNRHGRDCVACILTYMVRPDERYTASIWLIPAQDHILISWLDSETDHTLTEPMPLGTPGLPARLAEALTTRADRAYVTRSRRWHNFTPDTAAAAPPPPTERPADDTEPDNTMTPATPENHHDHWQALMDDEQ